MAFSHFCYILVNLGHRPQNTGKEDILVLGCGPTAAGTCWRLGWDPRSCPGKAPSNLFKVDEGSSMLFYAFRKHI